MTGIKHVQEAKTRQILSPEQTLKIVRQLKRNNLVKRMFVHVSASCTFYFLDLSGHEQHVSTRGGRGRNDAGDTNAAVSAPSTSIKTK